MQTATMQEEKLHYTEDVECDECDRKATVKYKVPSTGKGADEDDYELVYACVYHAR